MGRFAPIISTFTEVEGVKFYLQNQADAVGTGVPDGPHSNLPLTLNEQSYFAEYIFIFTEA